MTQCEPEMTIDLGENESCVLTPHQLQRESLDRFDDKLLANILSNLTFSEKVLFESVCKQWKRSVYSQQKALNLHSLTAGNHQDGLNQILEPIEVIDYNSYAAKKANIKQINKIWLKSLLRKCKSIRSLYLYCYLCLEDIDIIFQNCPNIKTIRFGVIGLNAYDLDSFGRRYGERLERIHFNKVTYHTLPKYWNQLLIHCKNLKQLSADNNEVMSELLIGDKEYLPKIEAINKYIIRLDDQATIDKNLEKFENFCKKFGQTLKRFSLSVDDYNRFNITKMEDLESMFNSIYKLNKLEIFVLSLCEWIKNDQGVDKYIYELSKSLLKLKKFYFSGSSNFPVNDFNSFKGFNSLVDLSIVIYIIIDWHNYTPNYENTKIKGSVECFNSSKVLKYLNISISCIGEEFFDGIDKHLPNLSVLRISCDTGITDKTILQLSHLKKLEEFSFRTRYTHNLLTDQSVCAVINGCPALKTMFFDSRPNITEKTIETLICFANSYPKRIIDFHCGLSESQYYEIQERGEKFSPEIDIQSFMGKIPKNLSINYSTYE